MPELRTRTQRLVLQGGMVLFFCLFNLIFVSSAFSGSFLGEYYNSPGPSFPTSAANLTRYDPSINFNWLSGSPDPAINSDNFMVRWTKSESLGSGEYTFSTTTDDGVRLWVDNNLLIDKWINQSPTSYTAKITLSAGNHSIKMEYYERGGGAVAKLNYSLTTDTTPPSGTIKINNDAASTSSTAVTLNLSAADAGSGMGTGAQMKFSNDGSTYSSPESYAATKSWTLTSGDGLKTVYAKFKDLAGNWSPAYSDTITLDTVKPIITITAPMDGAIISDP